MHYPEIDARLFLTDRNTHLLDEHIDVAVRVGSLPDSALVAVNVGWVRLVTCASPGYLTDRGTPATPEELTGHACIAFEGLTSTRAWNFPAGKLENPVQIRPRLVTNTAESAVDTAAFGLGVTRVLSYQAAAALSDGKLKLVLEAFEPPPLPISLVHAGQLPVPLKLRAFFDFARPRLQARLSAL
ncbi:LysR family transcriptional regulator (plasmid) [Caballeronia insecticola]|uniref:LysR family transcriptional regulator n=1 Tax=Caballeronia insecticola TaxID=758793 RepID=A0A060PGR3_9BURK|nr:LysR family transcriptional regulator [Caballeronia insecticola]